MKAAAFDYLKPSSIEQAIELLAKSGESAKVLAGGQTLIPMMAFRMAQPTALIDLNGIDGLSYIREQGETLAIGALTRHRDVERSELVGRHCPLLAQAIRLVAHPVIRNRGTAGGSLSHADPAAEWPTVAMALGAELVLRSERGVRSVPAHDFFTSLLTTALMPDEILVEIRIPKIRKRARAAFLEVSRRHGDFALVSVAIQIGLSVSGEVDEVALALGGVDTIPIDASPTAQMMVGCRFGEVRFHQVARAIAHGLSPSDDIHASAEYRRDVAEGLIVRALTQLSDSFEGHNGQGRNPTSR
ncbi:MAG: xanthine dehydrogenase family protein subunit M [Pseudorhodoplanes sp.]|uniref:FAD binding domain-containing protein n=1 Tax=Pseudorhodoplanes sp. TaxID=1934341 RepID=UPI003D148919